MEWLKTLLVVLQIIAAVGVIALVLVQQGKGADMGAAFGSGASGSLFGASGSSNFLSRSTGIAAAVFFVATLALSFRIPHRRSILVFQLASQLASQFSWRKKQKAMLSTSE